MPILESVATSVPSTRIPQEKLRELVRPLFLETDPRLARVLAVFDNARIDERAFAMPLEWYYETHGFKERNAAYLRVGLQLVEEAARAALARADVPPSGVDGVVMVSTTGLATPSLDARLANRLKLAPDALRVPVWGLGCAGGVAGLARAADLARAHPEKRFLLVALELCSLALNIAKLDKKMLVATSLFSDGCAAAVVSGEDLAREGPRIAAATSHLFPGTERVMGWDVEDEHLDVVFDPVIPDLVTREMRGLVDPFLAAHLGGRAPDHWILHPGGARVLDAYAEALGLSAHDLRFSSESLRLHGNMSSPTVLFALERALAEGAPAPGESALLAALGPGFASEMAILAG